MKKLLLLGLLGTLAGCGSNNLPTETGSIIRREHINKFKTAMSGDLVPRNASGNVTNESASLGSTAYKWLKARITSGYWSAGDIKAHLSYNGLVPIEQGWMLADGRLVNSANYETEHCVGCWSTYIGSSTLEGKYLPNLVGKYLVGSLTTTQTGVSAFASVGNLSNVINLQHSHTVNSHSHTVISHAHDMGNHTHSGGSHGHIWYKSQGVATNDNSYDSVGSLQIIGQANQNAGINGIASLLGSAAPDKDQFTSHSSITTDGPSTNTTSFETPPTDAQSPGTNNQLSSTQSIQPESIEIQYYVRIID